MNNKSHTGGEIARLSGDAGPRLAVLQSRESIPRLSRCVDKLRRRCGADGRTTEQEDVAVGSALRSVGAVFSKDLNTS